MAEPSLTGGFPTDVFPGAGCGPVSHQGTRMEPCSRGQAGRSTRSISRISSPIGSRISSASSSTASATGWLESLGRSGADEGIDIRGIERVRPTTGSSFAEADEDLDLDVGEHRTWFIQCKREKEFGPAKARAVCHRYQTRESVWRNQPIGQLHAQSIHRDSGRKDNHSYQGR
jgi:hypothetical protein